VTNLAFRLCGEAGPGQILMDQNTLSGMGALVQARPVGDLAVKGLRPVTAFAIIGLKN
jgi:adenylate cyclase